jgi:hypothetical protein
MTPLRISDGPLITHSVIQRSLEAGAFSREKLPLKRVRKLLAPVPICSSKMQRRYRMHGVSVWM